MACIHGFSPRLCQHYECSSPAGSDASTLESDASEECGSSDGDETSDEVDIVTDHLKSTTLGGKKGM